MIKVNCSNEPFNIHHAARGFLQLLMIENIESASKCGNSGLGFQKWGSTFVTHQVVMSHSDVPQNQMNSWLLHKIFCELRCIWLKRSSKKKSESTSSLFYVQNYVSKEKKMWQLLRFINVLF